MSITKEFRLVRKRVIREECYLMAMDSEHAERLGHEEEQEWEHLNSHDEIEVKEEAWVKYLKSIQNG